LPAKLLITALMNDKDPAKTSFIEKTRVSRFITPKSMTEPTAPTVANFKNRLRSFGSFNVN
jgi:hypothetical protein